MSSPVAPTPSSRRREAHPHDGGPKPPFPAQEQDAPGLESEMNPAPDYGVATYRGHERLKGRVALITGGDSGIGRAVALAFAREGADVAFTHLPAEQSDAVQSYQEIVKEDVICLSMALDLALPSNCVEAVSRTVEHFGRLDILVNNAAFQGGDADFSDLEDDRLAHTLSVNVLAPQILAREALKHMGPGGSIINVASIQAYDPNPVTLDYATTKGAMVTFTKGLAQSQIERGIRVNSVAPGPVWTPLVVQSAPAEKSAHFGESSPMKRPAQPAELAPAFVFLASDEARYINGEVLGVTGGRLLG